MSIADNIKQLRKQKHLTQKQLAEKSGLAVITIQEYEANKYNPKPDAIMKLCVGLDCKVIDIIDDEHKKYYRMFDHIPSQTVTENTPSNSEYRIRLQTAYEQLNDLGQEKVAEHAEMIAKIPEYRKKPDDAE